MFVEDDELTLDPSDWPATFELGHKMLEDSLQFIRNIRDLPVWKPVDSAAQSKLDHSLPATSSPLKDVYSDFMGFIRPYFHGNIHPKYWGYVVGTGTVNGILAELLTATMNSNVGPGEHGAVYVERQVIKWLKELFKYPAEASGVLTSGCSAANLIGLCVARNQAIPSFDMRKHGIQSLPSKLVMYASKQTHSSIQKAVEVLGLGSESLRFVNTGPDHQIDIEELKSRISEDRRNGYLPFCVVGNFGTVNTGAVDPIRDLHRICKDENLWLHIDGAFGIFATLSSTHRHLAELIQLADSVAFDLHKWMYVQYEAACILIKDAAKHKQTFYLKPSYLKKNKGGISDQETSFEDFGIQLSRNFRALKIWFSFKEFGVEKIARLIEQNIRQAKHLEGLIRETATLELLAPVSMNIVCFRHANKISSESDLNDLNMRILVQLQERGLACPTHTVIDGKYAIRVAITNHRSKKSDFGELIEDVQRLAKELEDGR